MERIKRSSETTYSVWLHSLSLEELQEQVKQLNKEHDSIMNLIEKESISKENAIMLKGIHDRIIELTREIMRRK